MLDNFSTQIKDVFDVFICCAGFEPRSKSVLLNMPEHVTSKVIMLSYKNDKSGITSHNIEEMLSCGHNITHEVWMSDSPVQNSDILHNILSTIQDNAKVLVDITSFTRELLLIMIQMVLYKYKKIEFSFCYVPSVCYAACHLKNADMSKVWLSRGVKQVRSVLGYSGELSPVKKNVLVILPGFEEERVQAVINAFEPDMLLLGQVSKRESISDSSYLIHKTIVNNICLKNSMLETSMFDFSCKNIKYTKNKLESEILKYKDGYNIICCPMNTKLSTIAVGMTAHKYQKIQICYASPMEYNVDNYSHEFPSSYMYFFSLCEIMF
ncbi:MAG: hypothetical protein MJZ84_02200 [Paludibacteraceae bacterium]|nr:hypothetical protein [Paludibacteraceae bacterium]